MKYQRILLSMGLSLIILLGYGQTRPRNGRLGNKQNQKEQIIPGSKQVFQTELHNSEKNINSYKNVIASKTDKSVSSREVILEEYFDTWPPADWEIYNYGPLGEWMYDAGLQSALHIWEAGANDNWLITPQLHINGPGYMLYFREFGSGQTPISCNVSVSTGSGNPDDGDFVSIFNPEMAGWWVDQEIDLSAYAGTHIYIAFNCNNAAVWRVDNVVVAPTSFIDGSLEEIVSPKGYTPTGGVENVITKLKNLGTENITSLTIEWSVNGIQQYPFQTNSLNLPPEEEINLTIGQYDFSEISIYIIEANLVLQYDQNPANNTTTGEYSVGMGFDLKLKEISPKGNYPNPGLRNVYLTVINTGPTIIDDFTGILKVDDIEQLNVELSGLGIQPDELRQVFLGEYDFPLGSFTLEAEATVDYDLTPENNILEDTYTVGALYEGFQHPEFPPVRWTAYWAEQDWWFPQYNDTSNTYVNMQAVFNGPYGTITDTLFTPLLSIETGDMLNFRGFFPQVFDVGTLHILSKDGETGGITFLHQNITTSGGIWNDFSFDISGAAGNQYIGFMSDGSGLFRLDDIEITAPYALYNNDLMVVSATTERIHFMNEESKIVCKILNCGLDNIPASNYVLKVMDEGGTLLNSVNGENLDSFDEAWLEIPVSIPTIGQHKVYVEIDYTGDQDLNNNISKMLMVSSVPENTEQNATGQFDFRTLYAPFNAWNLSGSEWGPNDITQTVYYYDEIGTPGNIYGIQFNYDLCNEYGSYVPLKVWIGETMDSDLEEGWLPYENLQLVYNDVIFIDHNITGSGSLYIPFENPYYYDGSKNLVVQHFTELPSYFFTNTNFWNSSCEGIIRTRSIIEETIDPVNPDHNSYLMEHYPVTTFVVDPNLLSGIISGVVLDENNEPLANAIVSIDNTVISVTTNYLGEYTLQAVVWGNYSVTTRAFGYDDHTKSIEVNSVAHSLDFNMVLRPQVEIVGVVVGSNDLSEPLENVLVTLEGYAPYSENTNSLGEFILDDVYGHTYYSLTLSLYGYYDFVIDSLPVNETNIDLGTLIMQEEFISAYNVIGNNQNNIVNINWLAPITSSKSTVINDIGYDMWGLANEPQENVWLGNKYENQGTITLTDVDVRWTFDLGGEPGEVTIDIFNENGELIASSETFVTPFDQWLSIDLPNLTITGDYYVMVHWKDNPSTTHFLGLCWDWNFVMENTAYIKFPGEDLLLLSLYWDPSGQQLPNYAMLIRPKIMEESSKPDGKEVLSYNIYRGAADDISNATNWEVLNTTPITETSYIDPYPGSQTPEIRYSVEAIYTEGNAELTFSNKLEVTQATQTFDLNEGFQFISSAVVPNNPDMLDVMADVLNDNLDFARNSQGQMLRKIGPVWVNGIGDWIVEQGYLLKMFAEDSFTIEGVNVNPSTGIPVSTGFQFVSYFPEAPMDALIAFGTVIGDNLDFIRDSQGGMLRKIGPNWVNGIGDVVSGEGYLVKMFADGEIIYPAAAKSSGMAKVKPSHLIFEGGNAAEPVYTMYINGLEIGDEVAAYNRNVILGSMTVISGNVYENDLPIFSQLVSGPGYVAGEPISLKVWSNDNIYIADFEMESVYNSYVSNVYPNNDGEFSVVNLKNDDTLSSELVVYPNPAKYELNISSKILINSIELYTIAGVRVSIQSVNNMDEKINTSSLKEGMYFIKINTESGTEVKKIMIKM